jgi:hypothetical protein
VAFPRAFLPPGMGERGVKHDHERKVSYARDFLS